MVLSTTAGKHFNRSASNINHRDPSNPCNKIILTCEHATNEYAVCFRHFTLIILLRLPPEYQWSENDKINFEKTHWACDIGYFLKLFQLA